MTNKYRPLSVVGKATYGEVEFEADLSVDEEKDAIGAGHLELVPRTYRVLSDNYTAAAQGKTFEAAFLVENEAALIQGRHIERVADDNGGQSSSFKSVSAEGGTGGAVTPPESKKAGK